MSDSLSIVTPLGLIKAEIESDPINPGISITINGTKLITAEFREGKHRIIAWSDNINEDEPIMISDLHDELDDAIAELEREESENK